MPLVILNSCKNSDGNKSPLSQTSDTSVHQDSLSLKTTPAKHVFSSKELDSINESNEKIVNYEDKDTLGKAFISKSDSSIDAGGNIRSDYRIFGYKEADVHSKKMIFISVFTTDVSGNPSNCTYGAYFSIGESDSISLKYLSTEEKFGSAPNSGDL